MMTAKGILYTQYIHQLVRSGKKIFRKYCLVSEISAISSKLLQQFVITVRLMWNRYAELTDHFMIFTMTKPDICIFYDKDCNFDSVEIFALKYAPRLCDFKKICRLVSTLIHLV